MDAHPRFGTQKRLGEDDCTKMSNGMPGIEERMRLVYHGAVGEGRLSLNRLVDVTATAPAKITASFPRRARSLWGPMSDMVIWGPNGSHVMSAESSHADGDYNAYEGTEVVGKTELVMARRRVLIEDGEYHGFKGDGRLLKRGGNGSLR